MNIDTNKLKKQVKRIIKKTFFLESYQNFDMIEIMKTWNIKFGKYIYKEKYNTNKLVKQLADIGIKKGDNIFLQSSWNLFYNYTDEPEDLINGILKLIGDKGTLAMPAFPIKKLLKNRIFDVRKSVTGAGIIPETFRKYPNVQRSVNVEHSVCAIGPLASYLTKDNFKSLNRFDEYSPYYRSIEKDFKLVSLGLTKYFIGTAAHCVHFVCRKDIPYYAQIYDNQQFVTFDYIDSNGVKNSYKSIVEIKGLQSDILRTKHIVKKYFNNNQYQISRLSNLTICSYNAKYMFDRMTELAKNGIYQFRVIQNS